MASRENGTVNEGLLAATVNAVLSNDQMTGFHKVQEEKLTSAFKGCLKQLATVTKDTVQHGAGVYAQKMCAHRTLHLLIAMIAQAGDISCAEIAEMFDVNEKLISDSLALVEHAPLTADTFASLLDVWSKRDDSAKKMPDDYHEIWIAYWLDACTIAASTKATVSCYPLNGGAEKVPHRIYYLTENVDTIYAQIEADWPNFKCSKDYFYKIRPAFVLDATEEACVCNSCQQIKDKLDAYKREILNVHRQDLPAEDAKTSYLLDSKHVTHIICKYLEMER